MKEDKKKFLALLEENTVNFAITSKGLGDGRNSCEVMLEGERKKIIAALGKLIQINEQVFQIVVKSLAFAEFLESKKLDKKNPDIN